MQNTHNPFISFESLYTDYETRCIIRIRTFCIFKKTDAKDLCCVLKRFNINTSAMYVTLKASNCTFWFVSYLVEKTEDMISRDEASIT